MKFLASKRVPKELLMMVSDNVAILQLPRWRSTGSQLASSVAQDLFTWPKRTDKSTRSLLVKTAATALLKYAVIEVPLRTIFHNRLLQPAIVPAIKDNTAPITTPRDVTKAIQSFSRESIVDGCCEADGLSKIIDFRTCIFARDYLVTKFSKFRRFLAP